MTTKTTQHPTTYVGIDPAFRKGGMAACFIENGEVWFKQFSSYLDFIGWVLDGDAPINAYWGVENSNMQDATFGIDKIIFATIQRIFRGRVKNLFAVKWTYKLVKAVCGDVASKSRNVGKNQAISQLTVWLLEERYGKERVASISPKGKGKGPNGHEFKAMCPTYSGRTNQDQRDAWKLVQIAQKCARTKGMKQYYENMHKNEVPHDTLF